MCWRLRRGESGKGSSGLCHCWGWNEQIMFEKKRGDRTLNNDVVCLPLSRWVLQLLEFVEAFVGYVIPCMNHTV